MQLQQNQLQLLLQHHQPRHGSHCLSTTWRLLATEHSGTASRTGILTVLACGAEVQSIRKLLKEEFPGMLQVETKSLHKGVKTTRHNFLPVPSGIDKIEMLAQVSSNVLASLSRTSACAALIGDQFGLLSPIVNGRVSSFADSDKHKFSLTACSGHRGAITEMPINLVHHPSVGQW